MPGASSEPNTALHMAKNACAASLLDLIDKIEVCIVTFDDAFRQTDIVRNTARPGIPYATDPAANARQSLQRLRDAIASKAGNRRRKVKWPAVELFNNLHQMLSHWDFYFMRELERLDIQAEAANAAGTLRVVK